MVYNDIGESIMSESVERIVGALACIRKTIPELPDEVQHELFKLLSKVEVTPLATMLGYGALVLPSRTLSRLQDEEDLDDATLLKALVDGLIGQIRLADEHYQDSKAREKEKEEEG